MDSNICEKCGGSADDLLCDNGCDTFTCPVCDEEWYYRREERVYGHDPNCGVFSDNEVPNSASQGEHNMLLDNRIYKPVQQDGKNRVDRTDPDQEWNWRLQKYPHINPQDICYCGISRLMHMPPSFVNHSYRARSERDQEYRR